MSYCYAMPKGHVRDVTRCLQCKQYVGYQKDMKKVQTIFCLDHEGCYNPTFKNNKESNGQFVLNF